VGTVVTLVIFSLVVGLVIGLGLPKILGNSAAQTPELMKMRPPAEERAKNPYKIQTQAIRGYMESMTLHEKISQMIIATPESMTGVKPTYNAGDITQAAFEKYPVGGVVIFAPNVVSEQQLIDFTTGIQEYSSIPLFISADEEGGQVTRLKKLDIHEIGPMLSYEDQGEEAAYANAVTLANALKKYGLNTDFAPVADVLTNPTNKVIGDRAYSTDFETAAILVPAAVRGFHDSGVACSVKHFPGHGGTKEDSHNTPAYVHRTLDELVNNEFKPFVAGINAGADMVMMGHLIVPELDDLPASMSTVIVTDVLRGDLGFDGVVITDSLMMSAVSKEFTVSEIAVTSVDAGVDILLAPSDVAATISALKAAVKSGDIPESRIDDSVERILRAKINSGIMTI